MRSLLELEVCRKFATFLSCLYEVASERQLADLSEPASTLVDRIRKQILKGESRFSTEPATVSTPSPVGNGNSGGFPITSVEETNS